MKYTTVLALFLAGSQATTIRQLNQKFLSQQEEVAEETPAAEEVPVAEVAEGLEGAENNESEGIRNRLSFQYTKPAEPVYTPEPEPYVAPEPKRYVPEPEPKRYIPEPEPYYPEPECISCPVQCDACDDVNPLYTSIEDAIDDSAREAQLYGQDGQATVSWEHSGAQSHQGAHTDVYPDVYKKVNGVENNAFKSDRKEREDWSGTRTKTFEIYGSITIDETQEGGLCDATNTCENGTGYNDAESLQRVGDACAQAPQVCSSSNTGGSYGYGNDCGCDDDYYGGFYSKRELDLGLYTEAEEHIGDTAVRPQE